MREFINIIKENWGYSGENGPLPTVLYHATAKTSVASILEKGLSPEFSRASLDAVFLASDISTAANYMIGHHYDTMESGVATMLVIDFSMLDRMKLGPDNYELRDLLSYLDDDDPCADLEWYEVSWLDSLRICSQVAYHGVIPASAIQVAEEYREEMNRWSEQNP